MQSNQQLRRDSLPCFLFAVLVGNASLCSGIWLYRSAGTAVSESPSVQIATIGGCAACAAMGLFFLFFALKQAKGWKDGASLPRLTLLLTAGASLLAFSLLFYRAQATILAAEEKKLETNVATHDAIVERYYRNHPVNEISESTRQFNAELRDSVLRYAGERLPLVHREQIVVAFASGLCALIGGLFVALSLRMWCSSQFHPDTPPVS